MFSRQPFAISQCFCFFIVVAATAALYPTHPPTWIVGVPFFLALLQLWDHTLRALMHPTVCVGNRLCAFNRPLASGLFYFQPPTSLHGSSGQLQIILHHHKQQHLQHHFFLLLFLPQSIFLHSSILSKSILYNHLC